MAPTIRVPRVLSALPAPVRWAAPPVALLGCIGLLLADWSAPAEIVVPEPGARAASYCRALAEALPQTLLGHPRKDPSPASPYVAVWDSSPRTVLRCGVPRPDALDDAGETKYPEVNGVVWFPQRDRDGGVRFTTTLRRANVEVYVPAGAYPDQLEPPSALADVVRDNVPQ
ncbi:DUF3515 domain-containing protein [Kitasatospora sp. NPDC050543]|uniref:DUF3515 domain-containing protein n=1 Tax=Kitasatospora sp. NPDC050543 TaxID=3364054 RepID=UPI0037996BF2